MTKEPCSGFEPLVADRVEEVMPAEGILPGSRECHDAQPGRRHVDWVYPDAHPRPLALEVTSIVAPADIKGSHAALALEARLTEAAKSEELGAWIVNVRNDADLRRLEREIVKVLHDAQPNRERLLATDGYIRPGWYTDRDLLRLRRSQWAGYIAEHERLKGIGLIELKPIRAGGEHIVFVMASRTGLVGSFTDELGRAVGAKAKTLARDQDLERHLGVLVERWDVSNEPAQTPVPEIPAEIDILWVVHRWKRGLDWQPVWVTRRGEAEWRVYETS
jgi:hypothetical protein